MKRAPVRWPAFSAALLALPACAGSEPLSAENAWIREAPPGAPVMAGYLRLHNHSDQPVRCSRASGADFGAIEIHRTLVEDGKSRMLRDQTVEVPAGGSAELAPGGYHLMLFRPQRPLAAGDTARVALHCDGRDLAVDFTVRSAP